MITIVPRVHRNAALMTAIFLAAIAPALRGQDVPLLTLGKRTGRTPFSFGYLYNAAELRDGRVIAADTKERAFRIVDFAAGEMPVLGEPGDGPLDYNYAGAVMPWKGDSLLLNAPDRQDPRLLHVSPDGKLVSASPVQMPVLEAPEHGGYSIGGPLAVDPDGSMYFQIELFDSTSNPHELADILRVSPDGKRGVVEYLTQRRKDQVYVRQPGRTMLRPFDFRDALAIRSDGLVARVVADTYQVIWKRNWQEVGRTGPLPFTPIPITAAEQTAYRDSMIDRFNPKPAADGGKAPAGTNGGGGVGRMGSASTPTTGDNTPRSFTPAPTTTLRIPDFAPFPDRKPAIPDTRWQRVAMFDPMGRLWVVRERAHGDNIPHVDIITQEGGLVAKVNLPKNTRLAGFGPKNLYLVMHDDDGDWLERYPLPGAVATSPGGSQ